MSNNIYDGQLVGTPVAPATLVADVAFANFVPEVSRTDGVCRLLACNPPSVFDYQIPPDDTASTVYGDDVIGGDI